MRIRFDADESFPMKTPKPSSDVIYGTRLKLPRTRTNINATKWTIKPLIKSLQNMNLQLILIIVQFNLNIKLFLLLYALSPPNAGGNKELFWELSHCIAAFGFIFRFPRENLSVKFKFSFVFLVSKKKHRAKETWITVRLKVIKKKRRKGKKRSEKISGETVNLRITVRWVRITLPYGICHDSDGTTIKTRVSTN